MPISDLLLERRRLSRQVMRWRFLAFVVFAFLLVVGVQPYMRWGFHHAEGYVAKLKISGVITGDDHIVKILRDIEESPAKALILDIDSPGGTTAGSERLYDAIRHVAEKKPTVAIVGTLGASGAYICALAADRIFVRKASLIGSIGVIVEYPNVSGLLDKIGVKYETIKSGPLKAVPNGLEPTSDAARAAFASTVADSFAWFKDLVRQRRGFSDQELARVDDGRIFTGRQGVALKLADEFGGESEALTWLTSKKHISKGLNVRDYPLDNAFLPWSLHSLYNSFMRLMMGASFRDEGAIDGLVSIWQTTY